MSGDELYDYDGPRVPSVAETGEEFVCLPRGEVERLRAELAEMWAVADKLWETESRAWRLWHRGERGKVRYILTGSFNLAEEAIESDSHITAQLVAQADKRDRCMTEIESLRAVIGQVRYLCEDAVRDEYPLDGADVLRALDGEASS